MYSPFKMKGKSPMMKALIGKQGNLPAELQAKIKASPATMKKESPAKDYKKSLSYRLKGKAGQAKMDQKYSSGESTKLQKDFGRVTSKIDKGLQSLLNNPRGKEQGKGNTYVPPKGKTDRSGGGNSGGGNSGGGNSGGGNKGYNSMKGDTRYTYKKNKKTGGYDFIDSKTNKKGTIKSTNKKAMDKLNSAFPMKKASPAKKKTEAQKLTKLVNKRTKLTNKKTKREDKEKNTKRVDRKIKKNQTKINANPQAQKNLNDAKAKEQKLRKVKTEEQEKQGKLDKVVKNDKISAPNGRMINRKKPVKKDSEKKYRIDKRRMS